MLLLLRVNPGAANGASHESTKKLSIGCRRFPRCAPACVRRASRGGGTGVAVQGDANRTTARGSGAERSFRKWSCWMIDHCCGRFRDVHAIMDRSAPRRRAARISLQLRFEEGRGRGSPQCGRTHRRGCWPTGEAGSRVAAVAPSRHWHATWRAGAHTRLHFELAASPTQDCSARKRRRAQLQGRCEDQGPGAGHRRPAARVARLERGSRDVGKAVRCGRLLRSSKSKDHKRRSQGDQAGGATAQTFISHEKNEGKKTKSEETRQVRPKPAVQPEPERVGCALSSRGFQRPRRKRSSPAAVSRHKSTKGGFQMAQPPPPTPSPPPPARFHGTHHISLFVWVPCSYIKPPSFHEAASIHRRNSTRAIHMHLMPPSRCITCSSEMHLTLPKTSAQIARAAAVRRPTPARPPLRSISPSA